MLKTTDQISYSTFKQNILSSCLVIEELNGESKTMDAMENQEVKDILSLYMENVLEGKELKSVYQFCKNNGIDESDFYNEYSSFDHLKTFVYEKFVSETVKMITSNEDYDHYSNREKLLSFYYTFFELLTVNRSYVVMTLKENENKLDSLKSLSGLRKEFKKYIETLSLASLNLPQEMLNKAKETAIGEAALFQLMFTMKFWLDDTSKGFEKTDSLIEKSVNASFDLIKSLPSESIFDLGKFLFKEKFGR